MLTKKLICDIILRNVPDPSGTRTLGVAVEEYIKQQHELKIARYIRTLSPSQRKGFLAQVAWDRDLAEEILSQNRGASYYELEFLYCERGGDPIRFQSCLMRASEKLCLGLPPFPED